MKRADAGLIARCLNRDSDYDYNSCCAHARALVPAPAFVLGVYARAGSAADRGLGINGTEKALKHVCLL
jgi:hypothetical protein